MAVSNMAVPFIKWLQRFNQKSSDMAQKQFNIVHLDRATIGPEVRLDKPKCDHLWQSYTHTSDEQVVPRLEQADIAVLNKVKITEAHLAQLPRLKLIVLSATGYDKIDIAACKQRNIVVSNIRGYAKQTVPEHTFALILSLRRSLKGFGQDVEKGEWQKSGQFCFFNHPISDLHKSTIGLIGTGVIGNEVARLAQAFGMKVIRSARKGEKHVPDGYVSFEEVLATSDIISLHCPLTPQTKNLIAEAEFRKMQKCPLIINTARGGLIHEPDLITALQQRWIAGAGIDVLSQEPPEDNHPALQHLDLPNLIVTPHIAWASDEAMQSLWGQLIGHIEAFVACNPRHNICADS